MKKYIHIALGFAFTLLTANYVAQTTTAAPYCCGTYGTGQCNQPGPSNAPGNFINDFINNFSTTGANTNISNLNSGCNGAANNCAKYCAHYMSVSPGQTIVCTLSSGNTFGQGFAIWIDWNQDNVHGPTEYMGGSAGVPAPTTPTTITFVIPLTAANGIYRMRVRCAFATNGAGISPCGSFGFGETEDYDIYVGPVPGNSGVPTGTALVNTPVCVGTTLNFSLITTYLAPLSYTWTGPGGYSSTMQNPVIANAQASASGVYSVIVSNTTCPITTTVQALVVPYPAFTVTPLTHTICQGGSFSPFAVLNNSPNLYSYSWTSTAPGQIFNPTLQGTLIKPALLPVNVSLATYVYSITVTPTVFACPVTRTVALTVNNPLTPTITQQDPLCNVFTPTLLTATPGGGTWSANPAVSPIGVFNPNLAAIGVNTVMYAVSVGTCVVSNSGTLSVSFFNTPALTSSISTRCVQDPLFNLMNIVQTTVTGVWSGMQVSNNMFNAAGLPSGNYTLQYNTWSTPIASVCPSSTTLIVPVFNPPTPVINTITPLCDNAPTVALTASPVNGIWSGNPGVSAIGIRTPSNNTIGQNTVAYAAGLGTCVATSTIGFHTSKYIPATLTGTIQNQCSNSPVVNLMGIAQNTTGSWGPALPYIANNGFNPSGLPTNLYTLIYKTRSLPPNLNLCPDSAFIQVHVLNPVVPNILPAGPFCNVNPAVQISVIPNIGYWVPSSFLSSSGIFTPSLTTVGNNVVQYVIGTNTCNAKQTRTISVEAFVEADITSKISDQCNTNPQLNLSPFTINTGGNWTGTGITNGYFDPSVTGSGNFTLTHHTSSFPSGLCPDQATVSVKVFSLAAPAITQEGPFCNKAEAIQLKVVPAGGFFGTGLNGSVDSKGLFNPALALIGDNLISYSISVGPCVGNAHTIIKVEKFVSADLESGLKTTYCVNNLPFNLNTFAQNPGYLWSGGKGVEGGNIFNPWKAGPGEHEITYQTKSEGGFCEDITKVTFLVKKIPAVEIINNNPSNGCAPWEVFINTPSVNSGKGLWNITDGTEAEGLSVSHVFPLPGTYSVVFTYQEDDAEGCSTSVTLKTPITVYEAPKARFSSSPEEVFISEPDVTLINESTVLTENIYQWNINDKPAFLNGLHPVVQFPQVGNYKVTLTATSAFGCKSDFTKTIIVKNKFNLFIPNSFTPNFDGLNDTFIPVFTDYGLDSKTFEMEIYDRWGHALYTTKDVTKGWNGTVQNKGDQALKQDTYVYKIRYKDLDGNTYSKTGTVSLLLPD